MDDESLRHMRDRLATYRQNLAILLDHQAQMGGKSHTSIGIINDIRTQRDSIRKLKQTLRLYGQVVEDHADDEDDLPLSIPASAPVLRPPEPTSRASLVDVLIVAPLREERGAVLAKLPGHTRLTRNQHVYIYYDAQVQINGGTGQPKTRRVIVTSPNDMGRVEAASVVSEGIELWKPRYVMLVGIAGGTPEQPAASDAGALGGVSAKGVRLGDVLVAREIVDYELQKLTSEQTLIRWKVNPVDQQVLAAAQHLEPDEWHALVSEQRPGGGAPRVHFGPVASGDKVVAYRDGLKQVQDVWSKLIGVEMEAGGAALKASQTVTRPGFFMVRGVSDLADERKNSADVDAWRAYACDVAAAYAVGLLQSDIFP